MRSRPEANLSTEGVVYDTAAAWQYFIVEK
jgi:hypothetical protein